MDAVYWLIASLIYIWVAAFGPLWMGGVLIVAVVILFWGFELLLKILGRRKTCNSIRDLLVHLECLGVR